MKRNPIKRHPIVSYAWDGVIIGSYRLFPYRQGSFWLCHASGEGMEIKESLVEEALKNLWREHF